MYIGWAVGVNKVILDSTDITVGEGATVQDSIETGAQKKSRLTCANPPDKFQVTMEFSFADDSKDSNGFTEVERFWMWYKWKHCFGTNPFIFPAILLNTNRQKGYSREEVSFGNIPDNECYKITSAVNGKKSGVKQQITMTWETFATNTITVTEDDFAINGITAHNGYVDVVMNSIPSTEPIASTWTVTTTRTDVTSQPETETITKCEYDGNLTARLYFYRKWQGTYRLDIGELYDTFSSEEQP